MTKKILFLLIGNIRYDGRVKKEIASLQKFGYKISLITTSLDTDDSLTNYNFDIHIVNHPSGTTILNKITNKWKFRRSIKNVIKKDKPDFIHCNDNTIFYVGKWVKKIKVIYDAHELLPELEYGIRKKITTYLERKKIKHVHGVIIPQIDRLNLFFFRNKDLIKKEQLYLLENFPVRSTPKIPDYFKTKYKFSTDKKILSYVGLLSEARKIIEIIEAVAMLENLVFFIIGSSQPEYRNKILNFIKAKKLENRVFLNDPIPNEEVVSVSESSDIGICFYADPNLNSYFCASNKLYENLNSGMAVLTNNIAGTARIITTGINGYIIDEICEEEIYKGLKSLSKIDPPEKSNFYWENQEEILLKIYS